MARRAPSTSRAATFFEDRLRDSGLPSLRVSIPSTENARRRILIITSLMEFESTEKSGFPAAVAKRL